MLTIEGFTGIDNQHQTHELVINPKTKKCALTEAINVNLDLLGQPARRDGLTSADTGIYRNLWQGDGFKLATKDGDLINVATGDVLYAQLSGSPRTWYANWPDGRTAFSNGLIKGITDGTIAGTTKFGVPLPTGTGTVSVANGGSLMPGRYQWHLTLTRTLDGLEGGTTDAGTFTLAEGEGTVNWVGLPLPPTGYTTNLYLSSHNDDKAYLAVAGVSGTTASFSAANLTLQARCKTRMMDPPPAGICLAFWRGRSLMAVDNLLVASRSQQWELFDLERDIRQFPAYVTMVMPVDGGIWVGTEGELAFLSGTEWDKLVAHHDVITGSGVVLGSGVQVDANLIGAGESEGQAAVCIADGYITAAMPDGNAKALTQDRYRTTATEVAATFRMLGEIPQYIAIAQ